jgi:hypothetical protein
VANGAFRVGDPYATCLVGYESWGSGSTSINSSFRASGGRRSKLKPSGSRFHVEHSPKSDDGVQPRPYAQAYCLAACDPSFERNVLYGGTIAAFLPGWFLKSTLLSSSGLGVTDLGLTMRSLRGLYASANHPIPQPGLPKRGKLGVQGGHDELHRLRTNLGDQAR